MARKNIPPTTAQYGGIVEAMMNESDRGCALVMSAWIDDALGQAIRTRFVDHVASADELLIGDSPLATFSARIKIAFCVGLIDDTVNRDLNTIRSIRNDFAHTRETISFESQSIKSRSESLRLLAELKELNGDLVKTGPRHMFTVVAAHLIMHLVEISGKPERPSFDPAAALKGHFAKMRDLRPMVERLTKYALAQAGHEEGSDNPKSMKWD